MQIAKTLTLFYLYNIKTLLSLQKINNKLNLYLMELTKMINEYKVEKCIFVLNRLMRFVAENNLSKKDKVLYNDFLIYLDNEN